MDPVSPRFVEARVAHLKVEVIRLQQEINVADREIRFHEKKIEEAKYTQELLRYFLAVTRKELAELTKDGQVGPASEAGVS